MEWIARQGRSIPSGLPHGSNSHINLKGNFSMGWFFSKKTKQQLVTMLLESNINDSVRTDVLEHHLADNVLWSVVRLTALQDGILQLKRGESTNFIRCDLLDQHDGEWGHKPLEEAVGPRYWNCPIHFLELAPEQSADWRAKVRQFHADNAQKSTSPNHS
jgi:hypothetical protein